MRRIAFAAALGGLGLAALAGGASAQSVEFKISHIFPSSHFLRRTENSLQWVPDGI